MNKLNKFIHAGLVSVLVLTVAACSSTVPTSQASALMDSALTAQQAGNEVLAKQNLDKIVEEVSPEENPEIVTTAYFNLGVLTQGTGDLSTAITFYKRALIIAPDYKPALFNLALAMTSVDTNSAAMYYTMLVQISPDDANALYNFGLLKYEFGDRGDAVAMLKKAIKIAPDLKKKLPTTVTLN